MGNNVVQRGEGTLSPAIQMEGVVVHQTTIYLGWNRQQQLQNWVSSSFTTWHSSNAGFDVQIQFAADQILNLFFMAH